MAVRVDDSKNIIVVTFAGKMSKAARGETTKEINSIISRTKIKNVVFHLDNCLTAEESVLFEMAEIVKGISKAEGSGRLVGVNDSIYQKLKKNSLDRILLERADLRTATKDMGYDFSDADLKHLSELVAEHVEDMKKEMDVQEIQKSETGEQKEKRIAKEKEQKKQVDVQFINHFLSSTTKVLEMQFGIESKPMKPYQKKKTDPLLEGQICGLISISSKYFNGTLSISFPEDVFLAFIQTVFGEEETNINEENIDLVSELANMVLGDAKQKLVQDGYKVKSALPHVFWNKSTGRAIGDGLGIVIPYKTDLGTFRAEVLDGMDVVTIMDELKSAA